MKPFNDKRVQSIVKEKKNIHGFKAPKDYFENFDETLITNLQTESLPKKAGFAVPNGYFEELEHTIINAVQDAVDEPKVISIFSTKRVLGFVAVAACLALVVTIFNKPKVASFEDLQTTTIADYFSEGNSNIDSNELIALLDDETITTLTLETELTSEQNIEDYLMDTLDDNTLLFE